MAFVIAALQDRIRRTSFRTVCLHWRVRTTGRQRAVRGEYRALYGGRRLAFQDSALFSSRKRFVSTSSTCGFFTVLGPVPEEPFESTLEGFRLPSNFDLSQARLPPVPKREPLMGESLEKPGELRPVRYYSMPVNDLMAGNLMRKGGLEPPRIAPLPPQDSVSTSSTTSASSSQLRCQNRRGFDLHSLVPARSSRVTEAETVKVERGELT